MILNFDEIKKEDVLIAGKKGANLEEITSAKINVPRGFYLATCPKGRFVFVFTPKHGSWLNMIESFFSKMTKQMLKGIRVESKEELERRIYLYFDEVNREPVVYRWSYKMDEISVVEAIEAGVKTNEVCNS